MKDTEAELVEQDTEVEAGEARSVIGEDAHSALIEALLLASGEPLSVERIGEVSQLSEEEIAQALNDLRARYATPEHGIELVHVAEKYQLRTKAVFAPFLRELRAGRPRRLSQAALETLSIVAYRQPVVRSDIEKIRGVDVTPTLKTLLERDLITIVGHQESVGHPVLYGTTEEFLKIFGLPSLTELPTLRDLQEVQGDPGEPDLDVQREQEPEITEADASESLPVV